MGNKVLDFLNKEIKIEFDTHLNNLCANDFSPKGKYFYQTLKNKKSFEIHIWDCTTGKSFIHEGLEKPDDTGQKRFHFVLND